MIIIPKQSQVPYIFLASAGAGYGVGKISNAAFDIQVNPAHLATAFAITTLANWIFFELSVKVINKYYEYKFSPEAIYTGSNATVCILASLAAQQFDLISNHTAGLLIFGSLLVLAARISILADEAVKQ